MAKYIALTLALLLAAVVPCRAGDPNLDSLRDGLRDKQSEIREMTLKQIEKLGPKAKGLVPDIVVVLDGDPVKEVRYQTEKALVAVGAVAEFVKHGVDNTDSIIRGLAARHVGDPGVEWEKEVPGLAGKLERILREEGKIYFLVRVDAARALGRLYAFGKLREALEDKEVAVRSAALAGFQTAIDVPENVRPEVAKVLPRLRELDKATADSAERLWSALAIFSIQPEGPGGVSPLLALIKDPKTPKDFRQVVVEFLGRYGPCAKNTVPILIKALKDEDETVRIKAVQSLGRLGPDAKEAVPALLKLLADEMYTAQPLLPELGSAIISITGREEAIDEATYNALDHALQTVTARLIKANLAGQEPSEHDGRFNALVGGWRIDMQDLAFALWEKIDDPDKFSVKLRLNAAIEKLGKRIPELKEKAKQFRKLENGFKSDLFTGWCRDVVKNAEETQVPEVRRRIKAVEDRSDKLTRSDRPSSKPEGPADKRESLLRERQELQLKIQVCEEQLPKLEKDLADVEEKKAQAQREKMFSSAAAFQATAEEYRKQISDFRKEQRQARDRLAQIEKALGE